MQPHIKVEESSNVWAALSHHWGSPFSLEQQTPSLAALIKRWAESCPPALALIEEDKPLPALSYIDGNEPFPALALIDESKQLPALGP